MPSVDISDGDGRDMVDMKKVLYPYNWSTELFHKRFSVRSAVSAIVTFQNAC